MICSDLVTLILYIWASVLFEKTVCSPKVSKSTCPNEESASPKTASGYIIIMISQWSNKKRGNDLIRFIILLYLNSVCHGQPDVNVKSENPAFWAYKCNSKNQCERFYVPGSTYPDEYKGLTECKLTCGPCSRLWPKPNEGYIQPIRLPFI